MQNFLEYQLSQFQNFSKFKDITAILEIIKRKNKIFQNLNT